MNKTNKATRQEYRTISLIALMLSFLSLLLGVPLIICGSYIGGGLAIVNAIACMITASCAMKQMKQM